MGGSLCGSSFGIRLGVKIGGPSKWLCFSCRFTAVRGLDMCESQWEPSGQVTRSSGKTREPQTVLGNPSILSWEHLSIVGIEQDSSLGISACPDWFDLVPGLQKGRREQVRWGDLLWAGHSGQADKTQLCGSPAIQSTIKQRLGPGWVHSFTGG